MSGFDAAQTKVGWQDFIVRKIASSKAPLITAVKWILKLQYAIREDARFEAQLVEDMIQAFGDNAYRVYCETVDKHGANWRGNDPDYGLEDPEVLQYLDMTNVKVVEVPELYYVYEGEKYYSLRDVYDKQAEDRKQKEPDDNQNDPYA